MNFIPRGLNFSPSYLYTKKFPEARLYGQPMSANSTGNGKSSIFIYRAVISNDTEIARLTSHKNGNLQSCNGIL